MAEKELAMTHKGLMVGTFLGPFASVLLGVAFIPLMHVFPPPPPTLSMHDFASFFRDHRMSILVGGLLVMCSSAIVFPFGAVIGVFMQKIERSSPVWTYTMLMACCMGYTTAFLAGLFFTVTAYRPDFSDEIIYALSTISFILMVCPAVMGFVQYGATGICILQDESPDPLLPRWLGYLNIWVALLFLPGQVIGLFMRGPFAWNGILAFWVPAGAYGTWIGAMTYCMYKAIRRLQHE